MRTVDDNLTDIKCDVSNISIKNDTIWRKKELDMNNSV